MENKLDGKKYVYLTEVTIITPLDNIIFSVKEESNKDLKAFTIETEEQRYLFSTEGEGYVLPKCNILFKITRID